MRTTMEMRLFPCRTCGAKMHEPCRTLTTGKPTNPHQSRWEKEYGGDFDMDEDIPEANGHHPQETEGGGDEPHVLPPGLP